jgi:hypothetical protein
LLEEELTNPVPLQDPHVSGLVPGGTPAPPGKKSFGQEKKQISEGIYHNKCSHEIKLHLRTAGVTYYRSSEVDSFGAPLNCFHK